MGRDALLLVEPGPDGPELLDRWIEAAAVAGLEARLVSEAEAVASATEWAANGRLLTGVIIGPHVERPVTLARRLHRALSPGHMLFLADERRAAQLRQEMSLAPMIGQYRILSDSYPVEPERLLSEMARSVRQRRQTRTTLDRINLGLVSRPALDSAELRKLVISDRYLAGVLQQAQDAILPLDGEGRIVALNRAAEVLFGVSGAEAVGRSLHELAAGGEAGELESLVRSVRSEGGMALAEVAHRRPDGSQVALEISVAPVRDEREQRMGMLAIARDVTERRRAEEERALLLERAQAARDEAEAASRAKEEFVATVSHELRTPLSAMLGWARLLRTGQLDAQTSARAVEAIERNAAAQARLIDDLLDISRIVRGKLRLNLEPVDLAFVVEDAIEAIRSAVEAKQLRLQLVLDSNAGPILGDPQRLQQVVWNLVSNAVKFTPRGGRVRVVLERINSHVELTVADTGQGISPEFLPHVFDRFRQADGSMARAHGGLGLGLSIVRHLVELHGGSVRAESEGEAKGATFVVRLPLSPLRQQPDEPERVHSAARTPAPFECSNALEGLRILVVEDEPDTLEMVCVLLRGCGAVVRCGSSAEQALDEMSREPVDLLISDIGMPGRDGYALLRDVRALDEALGRWTPAIALTAYARPEDRVRLLSSGFQAHLPKPVEPAELIAVILSQTQPVRR